MLGRSRRRLAATALATTAMLLTASPALAHFCYRDFNSSTAAQKAAKSGPWMTADEWLAFIAVERESLPPCADQDAVDDLIEILGDSPENRLYMGPGLLAGGTLKSGNTPDSVGYLPVGAIFAGCEE